MTTPRPRSSSRRKRSLVDLFETIPLGSNLSFRRSNARLFIRLCNNSRSGRFLQTNRTPPPPLVPFPLFLPSPLYFYTPLSHTCQEYPFFVDSSFLLHFSSFTFLALLAYSFSAAPQLSTDRSHCSCMPLLSSCPQDALNLQTKSKGRKFW